MRNIIRLSFLMVFLAVSVCLAEQSTVIELTRDNPDTLIGTNSRNYSIYGIRLGMPRAEVEGILKGLNSFVGVDDGGNPDTRIYVYHLNPDGSRGKSVFYLIWEPDKNRLGRIAVYSEFKELTENFRRLTTLEAVDDSSDFKNKFIGKSNRSAVTLDIPSINSKDTTYYYDEIGLDITYSKFGDKEYVYFCIGERGGS